MPTLSSHTHPHTNEKGLDIVVVELLANHPIPVCLTLDGPYHSALWLYATCTMANSVDAYHVVCMMRLLFQPRQNPSSAMAFASTEINMLVMFWSSQLRHRHSLHDGNTRHFVNSLDQKLDLIANRHMIDDIRLNQSRTIC